MRIEHIAYCVKDPVRAAEWYVAHAGFRVTRKTGPPTHTHFLADAGGRVMIEIYNNAKVVVPDYAAMDPLILHLAFSLDDVDGTFERLRNAGAAPEGNPATLPNGDRIAMLRDPWGFPIQLVRRAEPMV